MRVETSERIQVGDGGGSGDGNQSSSGGGNGDGDRDSRRIMLKTSAQGREARGRRRID